MTGKRIDAQKKPGLAVLGALPPPYMGPTLATEVILRSTVLAERLDVRHADMSDHREFDTLARFDLTNVVLGIIAYFRLFICLVRYRPRVVYMQISQTTIGYLRDSVFILISALLRRRVVCHLRGGQFREWFEGLGPLMRGYVRMVHRLVAVQIVLGDNLRAQFAHLLPEDRIAVVPNGKDVDVPPRPPGDGKLRILFAGNIIKTKGVLDVLAAVPRVAAQRDVEFHFIGAWVEEDTRQQVQAFLSNNAELPIVWHGRSVGAQKAALFSAADIFVFPTYYPPEGHPWVIVEAMAAGLPVISTDQGAITESVIHGRNGLITTKCTPEVLAQDILSLVDDAPRRKAMGAESRKLYEAAFTEAAMVGKLADILTHVAETGARG